MSAPVRSVALASCLLALIGCGKPAPAPAPAPAEPGERAVESPQRGDADYFAILSLAYENQAVIAYKGFWIEEAENYAFFRNEPKDPEATESRRLAIRLCDTAVQEYESRKLPVRRKFIELHHMDATAYRDDFRKRHPDRDLVFDEIDKATLKVAKVRMGQLGLKISEEVSRQTKANLPEAEFIAFRERAVREEVPIALRVLIADVCKMPAIIKMAAECGGR